MIRNFSRHILFSTKSITAFGSRTTFFTTNVHKNKETNEFKQERIDSKLKTVDDSLRPYVKYFLDEYQRIGQINTGRKYEDIVPILKILINVGVPKKSIYVYEEKDTSFMIFGSRNKFILTNVYDIEEAKKFKRDKYIDYKFNAIIDSLSQDIVKYVEEYQTEGRINTGLKYKDSDSTVKILSDIGIPKKSIYVYKEKSKTPHSDTVRNTIFGILFFPAVLMCPILVAPIIAFPPAYIIYLLSSSIENRANENYKPEYENEPYE
jgi:hypothetical protein